MRQVPGCGDAERLMDGGELSTDVGFTMQDGTKVGTGGAQCAQHERKKELRPCATGAVQLWLYLLTFPCSSSQLELKQLSPCCSSS